MFRSISDKAPTEANALERDLGGAQSENLFTSCTFLAWVTISMCRARRARPPPVRRGRGREALGHRESASRKILHDSRGKPAGWENTPHAGKPPGPHHPSTLASAHRNWWTYSRPSQRSPHRRLPADREHVLPNIHDSVRAERHGAGGLRGGGGAFLRAIDAPSASIAQCRTVTRPLPGEKSDSGRNHSADAIAVQSSAPARARAGVGSRGNKKRHFLFSHSC